MFGYSQCNYNYSILTKQPAVVRACPQWKKGLEEIIALCISAGQPSFIWLCAVPLTSAQFFCPLWDKLGAIPFIFHTKVKVADSVHQMLKMWKTEMSQSLSLVTHKHSLIYHVIHCNSGGDFSNVSITNELKPREDQQHLFLMCLCNAPRTEKSLERNVTVESTTSLLDFFSAFFFHFVHNHLCS